MIDDPVPNTGYLAARRAAQDGAPSGVGGGYLRAIGRAPKLDFSDFGYQQLGAEEFEEANNAVREDRGFFRAVGSGLHATVFGENRPFGFGSIEAAKKAVRYAYLDNKLRRGEASREEELDHLELWTEYSRQPGTREMAGDIVGALPGFGVEVWASAGAGSLLARGMMRGTRIAAARMARETAATSATRAMAKRLSGAAKSKVTEAVAKVGAGVAAGTVAVEAVPRMFNQGGGRWTAYALQKALPDLLDMDPEDWEALEGLSNAALVDMLAEPLPIWQGALDTAIEFGSEFAGVGIAKGLSATVAGSYVLTLQKRVLDKIAGRVGKRGADLMDDLAKRTRYEGPIVEMLEERLGDIARVGTGLEDLDQLMPEMDELAAEALALSFPALGGAVLRRALKVQRGDMSAKDTDFGGAKAMPRDEEIEGQAIARLAGAGVKNPRIVVPDEGSQEALAERWAAQSGRRLLIYEADESDTAAVGGVTFAPDLIVASRAEARPWRLAAHELQHTVQAVSTRAERDAQRRFIEAINPEVLQRAFADWQGAVKDGGKGTKKEAAPEGLEAVEGEATLAEWVAPLMAYAARNADGRAAIMRLAQAPETGGFWRRVWESLQRLMRAVGLGPSPSSGAMARADIGARRAASFVPARAQLSASEAAELALAMQGWIEGSRARVERWAGSPTAKATRAGNVGAKGSGAAAAEATSAKTTTAPGAESTASSPASSPEGVGPGTGAADTESVPGGAASNKPERQEAKNEREVKRHVDAVPRPGDVVQVTSRGKQGLAEVLETIGTEPEVRLRVRLRADHQGEPGGLARTGNRKARTVEVHRSEVRMHERRAPEIVGPPDLRNLSRKTRAERDAVAENLTAAARERITIENPVSVWSRRVRGSGKGPGSRSAASRAASASTGAPSSARATGGRAGAQAGEPAARPSEPAPEVVQQVTPTAAERRAATLARDAGFTPEPPESPDAAYGHQTDPPVLSPAEQSAAQRIAEKLLVVAKRQTRYQGNKARYLATEAWNLARLLATVQDSTDAFDWYAGGGSYLLSVVASGATPKARRVVLNEFDPVRLTRLQLALTEGGSFMDEWSTDPFLVALREHMDKLRGERSGSVLQSALKSLTGQGSAAARGLEGHAWFRKSQAQYVQLSPRAKAAVIAVQDLIAGNWRNETEKWFEMAREDADTVLFYADAVRARGIAIETVSLDAVSDEAVALVREAKTTSGKPAVILADPPYHLTSTGNYTRGDGSSIRMNSNEALAMYVHGAARMSEGNALVYHNNATPEARDTVYHALGGYVHLRTWKRTAGESEVVGYVYGERFTGESRARAGNSAQLSLAGAPGGAAGGAVLDRSGGDGQSDAADAGSAAGRGGDSGRGAFDPWFEPVGTIDWMIDSLVGAGARRDVVENLFAAQSIAQDAYDGWDPFEGWNLPSAPGGRPRADQSLQERLAARPASQRRNRPITLVDHILSIGGIDLRGVGRKNEGGALEDVILGSTGSNRVGIPAGLLYREDSTAESRGLAPDDMREMLMERGFTSAESDGRISFDDMADWIGEELSGGLPRVAAGDEGLLAAESARQQALRETDELLNAQPEDVIQGAEAMEAAGDRPDKFPWELFAPARRRRPRVLPRATLARLEGAALSAATWRDWYEQNERVIRELFQEDTALFADMLSATSQATEVRGNVTQALKAYGQHLAGVPFTGFMDPVRLNLERAVAKQRLRGPKIGEFALALQGDADAIAVDRHIAQLLFGVTTPTLAQIAVAKSRIRTVAARLGWGAREVQAALWAFNQTRSGVNLEDIESYDRILERRAGLIAELRARHGRGQGGGVPAGSGAATRAEDGSNLGLGLDEFLRFAPAKRTRTRSSFHDFVEEFEIDGRRYNVTTDFTVYDKNTMRFVTAFGRPGAADRYGDLGDEDKPATVFATVLASVHDAVRSIISGLGGDLRNYGYDDVVLDPRVNIEFTAYTERRARLYERLIRRVASKNGGEIEVGKSEHGSGYELGLTLPSARAVLDEAIRFAPARTGTGNPASMPAHAWTEEDGTINVDGVDRPRSNSEGQPIHHTDEGLQNFWRWFGASVVVDERRRPLVVHHSGTFDTELHGIPHVKETGMHFGTEDAARERFLTKPGDDFMKELKTSAVVNDDGKVVWHWESGLESSFEENPDGYETQMEAREAGMLAAPNRFDVDDSQLEGFDSTQAYLHIVEPRGSIDHGDDVSWSLFIADTKKRGHDGILYRNMFEDRGSTSYIVFTPSQVKSATANRGAFSEASDDIRFAPSRWTSLRRSPAAVQSHASRMYRSLRGMLVSDVQDVEMVQAEIDERVGITPDTDFVGAIDLARSRAPANVAGLIQRTVSAIKQLRGRATMEDLNRLAYVKSAPDRNAWMRVDQADRYLRERLLTIEARLKRFGRDLSPQQLGRLQGEVKAIGVVMKQNADERVNYARRRGVKISDSASGIDNLTAMRELTRLRGKVGAKHADELLEFIREENWKVLQASVAAGTLTAAKADEWHKREPYYVTLRDVDEELDEAAGYSRPGRSLAVRGPLWLRAQGREDEAERALEAWLEDKLRRHEHIARNEALQVGAAMALSDPKSGMTVLRRRPRANEVELAVPFFENGRQSWLLFPTPAAAQALKGLHGQQVGEILGMIGVGTRFFSRMVTSRNPAFWLPNFLRDTAQAMWTLVAERGVREGFDVLAGAWKVLPSVVMHSFGKKTALSPLIDQAILDGIKTTWVGVRTLQERLQEMHDALAPKTGVGVFVRNGLRTFDAISDAFETATRLSMYQHELQRGKSRREAALAAKNITVNFDKKGTLTPSLAALYSFFNPAVQGSRRIIEAATGTSRGLQVTALTVTMGLLWEMLSYALSDDDEATGLSAYGQLASWTKDRNLHMPFAVGGVYLTYPMPYGISSIFGFGRYMAHLVFDDLDPRISRAGAVQAAFWNTVNEFQPFGDVRNPYVAIAPTLAKPIVELKENTKFGGRPIMRDKVQFGVELPDSARAHSTIGDTASGWLGLKIAHVLNAGGPEEIETGLDVSPATVQHLIQWLGSGFGLREMDRMSQFALSSREVPVLSNTPFLRNFTNSVSTHATSESYYDLRDRAEDVWRRAKDARGEPRQKALARDPRLYQMAPAFDSADQQLRVLQRRMEGASRDDAIELQRRRLALQAEMVRRYYGGLDG